MRNFIEEFSVNQSPQRVIRLPGEGRILNMGAFHMTVKAEAEETGGIMSVLEADEPAGFGPPLHVHEDADEVFYVLSGEYLIYVAEEEFCCPEGSFIFIPKGVRHTFRVGSRQSRKLNIYLPAAMMGYFEKLASANESGFVLSESFLTQIARDHSMTVVGPVPEGYI
jgi:mannose-6-phosphate isomerase-like protein (cupin superfamily)